jgi:hypothetical protein
MISSAIGPYDFCILTSASEIDWPLVPFSIFQREKKKKKKADEK